MRLYYKLLLFMVASALAPVAVVGLSLLARAERELKARIGAQQATAAEAAAQMAARDVDEAVEALVRVCASIQWRALTPDERQGALRLVLGQSRHFALAALLDRQGAPVQAVLAHDRGRAAPELEVPPSPAGAALAEPFLAALPLAQLAAANPGAVAMSSAYLRGSERAAAAVLALRLEGEEGPRYVAVEMGLGALMARAATLSSGGAGSLFVVDAQGRFVACPSPAQLLEPADPSDRAAAASATAAPRFTRYLVAGQPVLASVARTPGPLGWTALIRLPEAEAFASVAQMRRTVLFSIGGALLLLLAAGFTFTRSVARRLERLSGGAKAFARGDLDARVSAEGSDEVAELAQTFNAMGQELHAARHKLESWNEELKRQVEARTAELEAAQAQLLEAQKLAAIGQLGAGVAHEINNPLAGILGNAQLLLLRRSEADPDVAALRKIEAQAKRAKEITANLLRFSQQRPAADLRPLDLNEVVREALLLVESQLEAEGIRLAVELGQPPPRVKGDAGHLTQVLLSLVANARAAMLKRPEKRLTLSTVRDGDRVRVRVRDTGKGIARENLARIFEPFFTTKDVWSNVGLGLSVSYRIVQEHGGHIGVETVEGEGSTFTVELPALDAGA
jgi:signal transduction histidine kinase